MNRLGFLGAVAASAAALFIPTAAKAGPVVTTFDRESQPGWCADLDGPQFSKNIKVEVRGFSGLPRCRANAVTARASTRAWSERGEKHVIILPNVTQEQANALALKMWKQIAGIHG